MKFLLLFFTCFLSIKIQTFLCDCPIEPPIAQTQQSFKMYSRVDILAKELLHKTGVAGLAIAVSQSGQLIYTKGFGYADRENNILMKPTSQIRAASVSKVMTATALGKLATDGKLDFDKPLREYLPDLKAPYANLTTRQIAGHTAGIPHTPTKKIKTKHFEEVRETLSFFDNGSLLFQPDTDYKYSTLGYNLLAILIEEISGKKYVDFMEEDIFDSLNMKQTLPDNPTIAAPNYAKSYYFKNGKLKLEEKLNDGSYKLAGAGFRSSSVDLVNMMTAYSNGFIGKEIVQDMFSSNHLTNGATTNVGIGWRMNKDISNKPTIEHAGSWQGARTVIIYYPENELAISIMINTKCTLFIEESAHIIAQYFLPQTQESEKIGEISKSLEIANHRSNGSIENYLGELKLLDDQHGELQIETSRNWLQRNNIYRLGTKHDYAVSTIYGLLYLQLNLDTPFQGQFYQYQSLNDPYHMTQKPMLLLRER